MARATRGVTGSTVVVEGLAELGRALKVMEATTRREIREKLKDIGRIVATEAQSIAAAKGLRQSGDLIRKIKPRVFARSVVVEEFARRKSRAYPQGFVYGRVYEYGGATHRTKFVGGVNVGSAVRTRSRTATRMGLEAGGSKFTGNREFMRPALVAKSQEIVRRFDEILGELQEDWNE